MANRQAASGRGRGGARRASRHRGSDNELTLKERLAAQLGTDGYPATGNVAAASYRRRRVPRGVPGRRTPP